MQNQGRDLSSYAWLTENAMAIQRQMGSVGVFQHYRPAFSNASYINYSIIINHLPKIHSFLTARAHDFTGQTDNYRVQIVESVLRHRGELNEERTDALGMLKNPFNWVVRGVRFLLAFPLKLLAGFGILGATTFELITNSWLFGFIASLTGFVGFLSAIIGIVTGWEPFLLWLKAHALWK